MVQTFVGYSTNGLDLAVEDAEKDLNKYLDRYLGSEARQVATTSQVVVSAEKIEYWFTLTVIFNK